MMAVEKGSFIPIVINTTGGMAKEGSKFMKRIDERLAHKRNAPQMANFVRKHMTSPRPSSLLYGVM